MDSRPREVDQRGNCSRCGGTHYGSYYCPYTDAEMAAMNKPSLGDDARAELVTAQSGTVSAPGERGTVTGAPIPEPVFVNPLVIMHELDDHSIACAIHRSERVNRYEMYGLIVADLVRHIARAFEVTDEAVWEWVDKEREHPTTTIGKPQ